MINADGLFPTPQALREARLHDEQEELQKIRRYISKRLRYIDLELFELQTGRPFDGNR